jgi:8-oxo-dGTP diphosphatase
MNNERSKASVNAYLVLEKEEKVLLGLRLNTGYQDGMYCLVSGHVEEGESATIAMCREANEEIGIIINPQDLKVVLTMHRRSNRNNIDIFMKCASWENDIINNEPDKCDKLAFFNYDNIPQNTISYIVTALSDIQKGITYSEVDWEQLDIGLYKKMTGHFEHR